MPTASSLLGVALVVRSKNGPQFVFHYPPRLASKESKERPRYGTELDPTTPDTSDDGGTSDDDDLEDDMVTVSKKCRRPGLGKKTRHVNSWDDDEHFESTDGVQIVPWEYLDAFSVKDLASILTPDRLYHKKSFELTLDPLHFITYPMHIREDGRWKKKKKSKKSKRNSRVIATAKYESANDSVAVESVNEQAEIAETDEPVVEEQDDKVFYDGRSGSENGNEEGGMTMFNLVFIMNPGRLEAAARVADMFEHVAKDVNKALRYAQNYSNYVWKESDIIIAMKDKAREKSKQNPFKMVKMLTTKVGRPMKQLWHKILEKSHLAAAIRDIFNSISNNNIANLRFMSNPPVRLSVQIPKPYVLNVPPDNDEEAEPGLWISTASCIGDQDSEDSAVLNKHSALLLLDDEEKIMVEVQADGGELAAPLLEYLKILKPTSSFLQTAQANAISLSDIRVLAQHLIYYRRAIAIPPLHARDTYILSPNSDNHQLPSAAVHWSKAFPLAPPLPTFLANLSSVPRPYKTFAPSKPHRPIYMNKLAWLLRNGWVTQLRNFAWVIVWPEIRYEVEYALDSERIKAAYRDAISDAIEEAQAEAIANSASGIVNSSVPNGGSTNKTTTSSETFAEKARLHRLREKAKQDQLLFSKRQLPVSTSSPSTNNAPHLSALAPKIIKDPYRANHVDSLYLEAISKRLKDEKSKKAWMRFVRYFDGKEALEGIALREGVKRKETWALFGSWEEFLLVARHW